MLSVFKTNSNKFKALDYKTMINNVLKIKTCCFILIYDFTKK